jgi:hypothetical protein
MIDDLFADLPLFSDKSRIPGQPIEYRKCWQFIKEYASVLGLALAIIMWVA